MSLSPCHTAGLCRRARRHSRRGAGKRGAPSLGEPLEPLSPSRMNAEPAPRPALPSLEPRWSPELWEPPQAANPGPSLAASEERGRASS